MEVLGQALMDAQGVRMDREFTDDAALAIVKRTFTEAVDTDEMASGATRHKRCGSCGRGAPLPGPPGASSNGQPKAARQTAETPSVPAAPCTLLPGLLPAPGVANQDLALVMAGPLLAGLWPGTISSGQPAAARQTVKMPFVPDAPCLLLPGLLPAPGVVHQDLTPPVTSSPLLAGLRYTNSSSCCGCCCCCCSDCYSDCSTSAGSRRSSYTSASDPLSDTS
jgi:hypothetical protein